MPRVLTAAEAADDARLWQLVAERRLYVFADLGYGRVLAQAVERFDSERCLLRLPGNTACKVRADTPLYVAVGEPLVPAPVRIRGRRRKEKPQITKREEKLAHIYAFIRQYVEEHGCAPTQREIADHIDIAVSGVVRYLDKLEARGLIERLPGAGRAIRIVGSRR